MDDKQRMEKQGAEKKPSLRERLHLGGRLRVGEKLHVGKRLKKTLIIVACVAAGCGAVWGGLTIARNAQRGDVNVYAVNDFAMTDYWGDSSNTSGTVTTDKLQKIYISQSQTVTKVWVKEGDEVRKGEPLVSYDSTLTEATVEKAKVAYDRAVANLEAAKGQLELLKKAENKEQLEAELAKLEKQLAELKEKYDKDPNHYYDANEAVTEKELSQVTIKDDDGSSHNVYYYAWTANSVLSAERLLGTTFGGRLRANEEKPKVVTNIVLVKRAGDKVGGGVEASWGVRVTEKYEKGTGADDYKVSQDVQLVTDLPAYEDKGRTYEDSEEITKLEKKIAYAQELVAASMSREELNKAVAAKTQEIKETEISNKLAKLDLDKKLRELGDGNVYAEFSGTVKTVRDATEAYNNSEAVVELSGGGGYYVSGTLSEMDLGSVKVGDTVQISSWRTGAFCEGKIVSIDDYPTQNSNNWGDGNRNASYYPFKIFVEEDANLEPNDYVDIQYQKVSTQQQTGSSLYLQSMFIREDNGKSYVMVRNEDGRLEQRWVQTGRDLWGSYTQIRGGLTIDDYVAFPYGRDVVEGAQTKEATADQLYNYGV
jgi:multidrug efflux pump subunit AcrA (membrane-fusion protein)